MKLQNAKSKIRQKGFTLIELLTTIAIIGILSGILFYNSIGIQQRARDGQRKADLRSVQHALELYRSDQNSYPTGAIACGGQIASGATVYMLKVPCDQTNSGQYQYLFSTTQYTYCLRDCLERGNDPQRDSTLNMTIAGCPVTSCTNASFTLQNP